MSVPQESLSDILSGKEPSASVAAEPSAVQVDETKGEKVAAQPAAEQGKSESDKAAERARDEAGKFKAAEKVDEKPDAKPRADVAAIIDERRKRQAAEARVRELEGKGGKVEKPSVLEDEDGAFNARIDEGTRGIREQLYHMSMKAARGSHGADFAAAEEAFANAAESDDRLIAGLRASADPGEYIYTIGLQIKELADVGGDFGKYREKITTESRAQLAEKDTRIKALEAQVATLTQQNADLETLPRSLNSRTSKAPAAGSEDPEDLKSIARFNSQSR